MEACNREERLGGEGDGRRGKRKEGRTVVSHSRA